MTLQHKWHHLTSKEMTVNIEPDSLINLTTIDYQPWQIGRYEVVASIRDRDNNLLGQNVFDFDVDRHK